MPEVGSPGQRWNSETTSALNGERRINSRTFYRTTYETYLNYKDVLLRVNVNVRMLVAHGSAVAVFLHICESDSQRMDLFFMQVTPAAPSSLRQDSSG